jgi:replicative DNA helicase
MSGPNEHARLRIPPNHADAEIAVLGSILLRPDSIGDVLDILTPETFYDNRNRMAFEAMRELFNKHIPIDALSLRAEMQALGTLDKVGGAQYISRLLESVPSAANVKHYADIVYKKHVMRRLIEAGEHVSQLGYDDGLQLEEMIDGAQKKVFEIAQSGTAHSYVSLSDSLHEAIERMNKVHEQGSGLRGVPTGYRKLDNMLSGLQKSDLLILAARPSVGKTSLALDIARHAAVHNKTPTLIFSLEMSAGQLVDRLVAAHSGVDAWKLRTGGLRAEDEFARVSQAADDLSQAPLFIDDLPGNNHLAMRSVARKIKHQHGLGLIIVDYLQLMSPTSTKNSDSLVQQVTEISRSLKHLAREMDAPVLALSQLNRAVEQRGGEPRLSDLRDSGSIEQDADVVMFIHREMTDTEHGKKRSNVAKIIIAKHRNGPVGEVEMVFDEKKTTYVEHASDFASFENMAAQSATGGKNNDTATGGADFF